MPVSFPSAVNAPGAASYSAPLLDFGAFGQWGQAYEQGVLSKQQEQENKQRQQLNQQKIAEGQRQQQLADALQGGGALTDGKFDPQKAQALFAKFGVLNGITATDPMVERREAANTPLLPPGPQGAGQGGAPSSYPAPPLPAPAANSPRGDSGQGTITSLVTDRLPSQNQTTGATIIKIAEVMGLDPNADLTPGQITRAQGLLKKYAPEVAGPASGQGGALPPSANAVSAAPRVQTADASSRLPPQGAPAQPQGPPIGAGAPQPPQAAQAPQGPPQPPQAAPQPQGGPIVPQVPLPPGFTDPQQAAMALRQRAAQIETANPRTKPKADELRGWADRIDASIAPIDVGASTTKIDPRTGKILYQGPAAAAYGAPESHATLDADAERYRQTGTLPPNMGRGIQGQQQATAIRTRAAELEINAGGDPAKWPDHWQAFRAKQSGATAEESAIGRRAGSIAIAVEEAHNTIPNVRSAAQKSAGKGLATWNKLENKWMVEKGDADFAFYVQQMNSLVNLYGRVISGGGKGTVSDLEHAREMLNPNMPLSAVNGSLRGFETEIDIAEKAPGKVREKMRGGASASQSESTSKPDAEGWTTLPNGARIREVK